MSNLRIGAIDVAVVSDGRLLLDPAMVFGDQTTELSQGVELEHGHVPFDVNCVLVRTGERVVLIDTGSGRDTPLLVERYGGGSGRLVENLRTLGVGPADIDTVIISHAHGDHVGGATVPSSASGDEVVPTFPEALYWLWATEWSYWTAPDVLADRPYLERKLPPLLAYGQVELADEEVDVAPGVRLIPAPGHTPGHMCVAITSGQEMALYTGDLLHHAAQLEHPEWAGTLDLLPDMSAASRERILRQAAREKAVLITAHLPTPGIARHSPAGWRAADD